MKQPGPNKENVVPQVTAHESIMSGNGFSIKLFVVAFVLTGAVLAWLSWSTYDLYTDETVIKGQIWRTEELRGTIIHLDEVLTMSARMAAATGDPQWEARYRKFEPKLDQALKEILKLAPSQTLAETDAANLKLVEMENRAFTLVRESHAEEAQTILSSEEYQIQKGIYVLGMNNSLAQLQAQLDATHKSELNRAVFSVGAGIVVLAILLFSWLAIIRRMYKAHAVLLTSITRRKQTEEALHESERGFRQLADAMPQIVWTSRPDGWLDYYNQRWFDYTGLTLEETEGWGWAPVLHPDDLQNCIDSWSEAVRTGNPYEVEYRFKRASDGFYRWHLGRASAVRDAEGRIVKWFGTCTDIDDQKRTEEALELGRNELETRVRERTAELVTVNVGLQKQMDERRRAEAALRESEGRYRELVDNGQGLICTHDLNGKLLSVNPAAAQALGYAPSEMVGKGLIEFISPTAQPVFGHYLKLVAAQPSVNGLMNLITKEGEERVWAYRNSRIEGQRNAVYILGHAQDITEQERTEEALRQQRDFTTAMTGSIAEGIYALDLDGMVTFMNPAAEQLLGWKQVELPDRNMHDIIHFQSAAGTRVPAGQCPLLAVLRSGKTLRVDDDVFTRRDGAMLPVSYTSSPIISNGQVLGAVLTFHDITERKRAEAERRALAEIVQGVITTSNLDELFTLAHQAISQLLPAENCYVALYDKTSDLLHVPFCKDEFDEVAEPHRLGRGLTAFVLRNGRPKFMTPELIQALVSKGEIELVGTLPAAWLGVPLRTSTDIIGVLVVQHYEDKNAYSQQDLELLASVGDQLGLAIERKQIEIELKRNEMQLTAAQHITKLGNWEWDVLTNNVRWSNELYRIFGVDPEEPGSTFGKFLTYVHPDDRKLAERAIEQALGDKVLLNYDYRIIRPDGTIRALQCRGEVVVNETDQVTSMWGTIQDITERKQLENTLRQERIFLRTLIDHIPDSVYVKDMACCKVMANLAEVRISGLQSEVEILGKDDFAIYPKEMAEKFFADDQVVLQTGQPVVNREEYVLSKQGQKSWLLTTKIPLRDENGKIVGLIGLGRDITERKRADEALIESERRFRDLFYDAPVGYHELDTEGRITGVNTTELSMLGYSSEEMIGHHVWEFIDEAEIARQTFAEKLAGNKPQRNVERSFRRKDGTLMAVQLDDQILKDPSGRFIGIRATMQDIGERKQAEQALIQSERRFRDLFENASDLVCTMDLEGNLTSVNKSGERMTGYTESEAVKMNLAQMVTPEMLSVTRAMTSHKLEQDITTTYEVDLIRKDGGKVTLEISSRLLHQQGQEIGIQAIGRDITQRKQVEAELEQARDAALESVRLKSEFLANMSHEIRTPMNGVIGMTGLLLETELTSPQREYTETIQFSAEALLRIINDILDFSKIESGQLRFEKIDFELRGSVEGPVELLAERAQAKGLELASLVYRDVPTALRGDPGRLRQVLTNLIGNAVKFTDRGEVVVSVTKVSETASHAMLRFEIQDTGIGISAAAQRGLFRAFTQADGSTTRKYGGTGLGLAISKQLVELMGGEIGIESAPDHGSTFWFTGRFEKRLIGATASEPAGNLSRARVLIVDDNATNRNILKHQTSSWGMIPTEAESGERALELLRAGARLGEPYDIAVLDLMMPEMDGFQLAEAIKSDPTIAPVALVLLPSFGKAGHGERALQVGIAAYLQKPVRQEQLYDCLTAVIARSDSEPVTVSRLVTRHSLRESALQDKSKTFSNVRIIVAEDNLVNQKVALGQLYNLGHHAQAVANGRELLAALDHADFDIVLMDCQMPEMDGFAATAEIRRREGTLRHTTIIAMTANALEGDEEKCLAASMDDYLSKPVSSDLLRTKLDRWIIGADNASTGKDHTAPVAQRNGSAIDLSQLAALREIQQAGQADFVTEVIDLFFRDTGSHLKILRQAVVNNDALEVRRLAHLLKGSSANIGARSLAALYEEMEEKARNNGGGAPLLARIEKEFAVVREALSAERRVIQS